MERMTNIQGIPTKCVDCPEYSDCYGSLQCDEVDNCLKRLKAYEDTNLTPEQITEIDNDYRALCEKMAKHESIIAKFGCYEDCHPITCLHCPHVLEGSKCECRYTELL
ncbi:MAG: hypothetical protein PUJ55_05980 [Clostridiales bacterium]|nr:hypothetical protein [Roseburia sp.]MDD7636471.1 hypothetical protein [Clostridiales bacterium]